MIQVMKNTLEVDVTKSEILLMSAEDYMSDLQLQFFRELIHARINDLRERIGNWREELERLENVPDPGDAATIEEQRQKVTSSIRRDASALDELVEALSRIEEGSYGYCETGPQIGLLRLLVLPSAKLCVEEQERREARDRHRARSAA
jgi:DnaK suppressor protein